MTDETTYSKPRFSVTKYTVYPEGYDQGSTHGSNTFCVYVEQFPDTGKWYIHDGTNYFLSTHKAVWVARSNLNKKWTRFDTAEEALDVALKAVDTRYQRRLVDWLERSVVKA